MAPARRFIEKISQPLRLSATSRSKYKKVWTSLSRSEGMAKLAVLGCTDEQVLERSACNDFDRLLRAIRMDAESVVLEIGCGVGRLGKMFAPVCRTWTGCDVSPAMLRYARQRLREFNNTRFVELSGYDLGPIADSSQDIVYSTVVFMHLTEWDRYNYILEARRILKPGGQLYVDNISLTTDYGWKMFEESRSFPPEKRPPHIASASTPQEFEVYLSRAGFTSGRVEIVDNAWVVGTAVK